MIERALISTLVTALLLCASPRHARAEAPSAPPEPATAKPAEPPAAPPPSAPRASLRGGLKPGAVLTGLGARPTTRVTVKTSGTWVGVEAQL
ncbi:MAG: hypothetical protein IPM79_31655 [Polyangiaceae bacterium]|jgi:hypothetical protein|nr:hypothetical protein [Polyangiaceae bacterium]MBK8942039.1 hypothetical protein [Polyangiaceae bacterium]